MRGVAGYWAEALQPYTEASAEGILVSSLVSFGSAVGRTASVTVGGTPHYANEFVALVGPTATARKGDTMRLGQRLVLQADSTWDSCRKRGFGSAEALVDAARDDGGGDGRLLVYEDELVSILNITTRKGDNTSAMLRSAWDGGRLEARSRGGGSVVASSAHVSILAGITPEELRKCVSATEIANGFLNRFLIVAVRRSRIMPSPPPIPPTLEEGYVDALSDAIQFAREGRAAHLRRDAAANELWDHAYREELSVDRPGLAGAACSRAEAHALRLQIIYALLDKSTVIRLEHVEAAIAVWRYCEESAFLVFGDREDTSDADVILSELVTRPDGLSRDEIRRLFSGHRSSDDLSRVLDQLVRSRLVQEEQIQTSGRPQTRYRLTSAAHGSRPGS